MFGVSTERIVAAGAWRKCVEPVASRERVGLSPEFDKAFHGGGAQRSFRETADPSGDGDGILLRPALDNADQNVVLSGNFGLAKRAATILTFLYVGSAVTSSPIQSGSVNFWSASVSSISAKTTPSKSPS